MKNVILSACVLLITASSFASPVKVSEKVLKAFEISFSDAENVTWTEGTDMYTVRFTQQGISTYVNYDNQGNFLTARRYYQAAKLPIDVQCRLQKKFPGKTVFGVAEITVADEVSYFVKLEDEKIWTNVKIDHARNIEVIERLNKQ